MLSLKVEFPEARIYEEMLNIILFEKLEIRPDTDLQNLRAAFRGPPKSGYHSDDDDFERNHSEVVGKLRRK